MPPKPIPTDLPIHAFSSISALETFYEHSHTTLPGFHLKLAKKASGIPSVSSAEAVETALCFGWIDGVSHPFDDNFWLTRYTPRRARSIWSQKNVGTVGRLIEEGRMRPAGLEAVEAAKGDGRWDRAYASPANIEVHGDLAVALKADPQANAAFEKMNKTDRYPILLRVQNASQQNRARKIVEVVRSLAAGPEVLTGSKIVPKRGPVGAKSGAIVKTQKTPKTAKKAMMTSKVSNTDTKKAEHQSGSGRRIGLRSSTRTTPT